MFLIMSNELEILANQILNSDGLKPNLSKRDFFNSLLIFQNALMDKLFDLQDYDNLELLQREKMATKCGEDLRKFIHTYTGLDPHKLEDFL